MKAILEGHSYTMIQQALHCSSKSIAAAHKALERHQWSKADVENLTNDQLEHTFPDRRTHRDTAFGEINYSDLAERLRQGLSATPGKKRAIKVEYERYVRQCDRDGTKPYSYAWFAALVSQHINTHSLSWPLTHEPGHKMFVDWSGDKMRVGHPDDPDSILVSVFVATLPHSGMVFAKCYPNERSSQWIQAHIDACAYFGGVPALFVPDNASTASFRPRRDDPARDIATDYQQFAEYYHAGILPTRPGKPKHKAHVERHVHIIQQWVGQYFDSQVFDTLDDLNDAVLAQVDWINQVKTPYRGASGHTRYVQFVEYEQPFLRPLPEIAYEPVTWAWATARPDCHLQVDKRRYSVPYQWVGTRLKIGIGQHSIKIYSPDGAELIACHARSYLRPGTYVTAEEHKPPTVTAFGALWTRSRYETWAKHVGPWTAKAITIMLDRPKIEQQAFLTCENTLSLGKRYSNVDLEQACEIVLTARQYVSYRNIKAAITAEQVADTTDGAGAAPACGMGDRITTTHPGQDGGFENAQLRGFEAFIIPSRPVKEEN